MQSTTIVPSAGIPVTEYWLESGPIDDQVKLVAVIANGVAAIAETLQSTQLAARSIVKWKSKRRLSIAVSIPLFMLHLAIYSGRFFNLLAYGYSPTIHPWQAQMKCCLERQLRVAGVQVQLLSLIRSQIRHDKTDEYTISAAVRTLNVDCMATFRGDFCHCVFCLSLYSAIDG
jgi:hypothetical protein